MKSTIYCLLSLQMLHNKFSKDWSSSIGHLSDSGELVNLPVGFYRFPGTPYSPFPFLHFVFDLDNIY